MLSLRYHIVSIVAIFLALAVGVALGSGPLQRTAAGDRTLQQLHAARAQVARDRQELRDARAERAFADDYASSTFSATAGTALRKRSVAVVALPGADAGTVTALTDLVERAGGSVTGTVQLDDKTDSSGSRQLVDALTSQMAAQTHVQLPTDQPTYVRLGAALGRVVGTSKGEAASYDDTATSLLAGMQTAGLVTAAQEPTARAGLVLVVAGAAGTGAIGHDLVAGLADNGHVVVAGPGAQGGTVVHTLRADRTLARKVSTVDSAESAAGQAVSVLALARAAGGGSTGSFGASGDSGTVPRA